jgi:2C-methyl-D-erythritol 2,4-cyclodiphosphate synthase
MSLKSWDWLKNALESDHRRGWNLLNELKIETAISKIKKYKQILLTVIAERLKIEFRN